MSLEDGKCHHPLSQGPCRLGYWLAVSDTAPSGNNFSPTKTLQCVIKRCKNSNQIYFNGKCVDGSDSGPACKGRGQQWVERPDGVAVCVCEEGYLPSRNGTICVPPLTRGHCKDNQIVIDANGIGVCVTNPCGLSSKKLPFRATNATDDNEDAVAIASSETSYTITEHCHDSSEVAGTGCIPEIDDDYDDMPLKCMDNKEKASDTKGKKTCGSSRLPNGRLGKTKFLCKRRGRCVTVF